MLMLMDFLNEAPIEALFADITGKPGRRRWSKLSEWLLTIG